MGFGARNLKYLVLGSFGERQHVVEEGGEVREPNTTPAQKTTKPHGLAAGVAVVLGSMLEGELMKRREGVDGWGQANGR